MYNNNIIRRLDSRGRLVIPIRIREVFDIESAAVEIFSENDLICIRKHDTDGEAHRLRRPKGTSMCNRCICSSCTGFGCPWLHKVYRYSTGTLKRGTPERCRLCIPKKLGMIHDCDFYTRRKLRKFYVKRSVVRKEGKFDVVLNELRELKKLIDRK
jgi:bifunctional DNA-binding transcriptional regulator/antitoxin component of YhaV-PrlF toxin-antitoxin module